MSGRVRKHVDDWHSFRGKTILAFRKQGGRKEEGGRTTMEQYPASTELLPGSIGFHEPLSPSSNLLSPKKVGSDELERGFTLHPI
jgi:hypothetical protein